MKKRLFISYSKDNHEVAKRLLMHLENQNANHDNFLEFFLDTKRLKAGFEWDPVIQQNLKCAHGYLFLVSIDALSSPYIKTNELPAMAFEYANNQCPIYLFLVSECAIDNYSIQVEGSDRKLSLGGLEHSGPKQDNGRRDWYNQLKPEQTEKALSQAAQTICESMKALNVQKSDICEVAVKNEQRVNVEASRKIIAKPRVDNLIAYIDRYQISDLLKSELRNHVVVAVATNVIETDWAEGIALRFGYEKLEVKSGHTTDPIRFDLEWPLVSSTTEVREKTLWMNVFEQFGIPIGNQIDQSFYALWGELKKLINKKIRIVIHYRIRNSKSQLSNDKSLALLLAKRWKSFIDTLENPVQGRIILLFSINLDVKQEQGFFSMFSKKAIDLKTLYECLKKELSTKKETDTENKSCCVINGGQLSKIVDSDIERWKKTVKGSGIEQTQSETILLTVEENIPEEGIRHRTLKKKIKKQETVRELFKVT